MALDAELLQDTHDRVNVLGVGVSAVSLRQAIDKIAGWIEAGSRQYVCVAAAHSVMACRADVGLRKIFNRSGMTTPDGMPLVWLARLHGYGNVTRVYGPDLMLGMSERMEESGQRCFLYGATQPVVDSLCQNLRDRFPGLKIVGTNSPPFRSLSADEKQEIVARINSVRPDLVWVALGTGKQERWMAEHLGRIEAPVMVGVGAAFNFLSGHVRQAPAWLRNRGFEWLYRLLTEPRRLAPRYAEYPRFVWLVAMQLIGVKSYPLS